MLNIDRFERYIAEGRLLAGRYLDTDDRGRELACFYAAVAPDGADRADPGSCPANALQPWIAHLLPWLDDSAADDAERYARARRLVPILRRVADPQYQEALRRADYACRTVAVREAQAAARIAGSGAALEAAREAERAPTVRAAVAEALWATAAGGETAAAARIADGILDVLEGAVGLRAPR